MGTYSRTYNFTDGTTAYGSQVAFELDALGTSTNNITNAQIAPGSSIADSKLAQITTAGKVSGAAITLLTSVPSGAGELPDANQEHKDGNVIQTVYDQDGTVATGTTQFDDAADAPLVSEGWKVLEKAITPSATTNILKVDVVVHMASAGGANFEFGASLVNSDVDATNAIACGRTDQVNTSRLTQIKFTHFLLASDANGTSATTFSVRIGASATDTVTFNGEGGAVKLGDKLASSLTITEIKAS